MQNTALPLFRHWPALSEKLAHTTLCELPTPVSEAAPLAATLGLASLHIKRDDLSAPDYGGNKIRKLEFLLAEAARRGHQRVLTFGFAGSNFAAATALNAHKLGMRSTSMLLPQANAAYLRENLLISLASEAQCLQAANEPLLAIQTLLTTLRHSLKGQRPYWIPAGGSSPVGLMGFVNAAVELKEQIEAGQLPRPAAIYVAMGSMGTAAGLAVGLAACGLEIPIHAVRVVPQRYGNARALTRLIGKLDTFIHRLDAGFPDTRDAARLCQLRDDFFGAGYGVFTEAGTEATQLAAAQADIELDGTYSAKAMAALIHDARAGRLADQPVLFWNTHNSRDTAPLIEGVDYRGLPSGLRRYFEAAGHQD